MKIGIVTLPLYTNYGGLLQAFALQTVLKRLGHEPVTFMRKAYEPIGWRTPIKWVKRLLVNPWVNRKTPIFYEYIFNKTYPIVSQFTQGFIDRNINIVNIENWREIKNTDYEALIVGSDQVWRPMYFNNITAAFLDFASDWHVKRLAYAVSFGTDEWEYNEEQTLACRTLASLFQGISVREKSGINLCREFLACEAVQVLDPTMLLEPADYVQLFEKENTPVHAGDMLVYILDRTADKQRVVDLLSETYEPFVVNSKVDDLNCRTSERIQPAVESWLRGFYDARMIVTDSFHACVFAILFNKPFVVYGNSGRGMTRFVSLLSQFGLEHLLLKTSDDLMNALTTPIDWCSVNTRLRQYREHSMMFILKYVGKI